MEHTNNIDYKALYEQSEATRQELEEKIEELETKHEEEIEELTDERDEYYEQVWKKEEEMNDKVESFCAYLTGDWKQFRAVEETFRETYTEEFIQANKEALEQYGLFEDD